MATSRRFQARNGLDNNSLTLIGVATPVNTTDAANKAYADTKLALTGGTLSGSASGSTLELLRLSNTGTGANTKSRLNFYAASGNYGSITGGYGASAPEMVFDINTTAGAYIWNNNATEQMRINASGNVGIGTNSPGQLLVASSGTNTVIQSVSTNTATGGRFRATNADGNNFDIIMNGSTTATNPSCALISVPLNTTPLLFYMSGVERMRLSSVGFGIGTNNPAALLHVSGSGTTQAILTSNDQTTTYLRFTNTTHNSGYVGYTSDNLVFLTGGSERMRLDSRGNLGLGVTPQAWNANHRVIELAGASSSHVVAYVNGLSSGTNYYSNSGGVLTYSYTGQNATRYLQNTTGQHQWFNAPSGTAGTAITFTQAMTLDASGNLGLGVTPSAWDSIFRAVQVGSANYFSFASQNSAACYGSILWNAYGTGNETFVYNKTGDKATRFAQQYDFRWYLAPSGTAGSTISFTEAMRITSAGDVGIGTSSPSAKLDVAGTVRTTGQLTSTVATGTAPFVIASTTRVANLNVATAGTADLLTTARNINEVSFNGSANITVPRVRAIDNRTAAPSAFTTAYATVGFGSWNNNNTSPYADYIVFRTYTDATGGNDNMVSFRKDAIGMRVWQQTYGSATAFATFKDVAFTDSNITGSAASLTTTRTLWGQNFNGTANVTGSLTSVGDITGTGAVVLSSNNAQLSLQAPGASGTVVVGANSNNAIFVNSAGKVGIGAANLGGNPLEVAGNLLAYASVPGGVIVSGVWNSSSTANSNAACALYNDLPAGNFAGLQYFTSTNNSELRVANNGTNTAGTVAGEITFHNGIGANYVRRARINSTGEFVLHRVNTTSAGGMLRFQDISGSELYFIDVFGATASTSIMRSVKISTGDWQWISNGLALRMSLTDSGALGVNATPSTTAGTIRASSLTGTGNRTVYSDANGTLTNTSSDATLKNNVQNIQYGLSSVLAMRPVSFNWIDEERFGSQTEIGFIAQEIQQIVPEVIGENSDQTLSLDYPKLIAVLTKAIQDQQAIIADITQRLTVLEGNT